MKTIKNFLFFISAFFALSSLADISCEAYKQQVINDCDAILSDLSQIQTLNNYIAASAMDIVTSQSSDGNSRTQAQLILGNSTSMDSWISSTRTSVNSIRLTAVQLQCASNSPSGGSCDCASVLDSLLSQLQGFRSEFDDYQQSILAILTDIHEWISWDNDLLNQFLLGGYGDLPSPTYTMQDVINFYNSIGSNFTNFNYQAMLDSIDSNYNMYWFKRMGVTLAPTALRPALYRGNNAARDFVKNATFKELLYSMGYQHYLSLASLNNYAWTNTSLISSIEKSSSKIPEIQERFSIFNDFVFSSDAPLSMYTDMHTDGSYHDYLTNYYIKVSKGQQSGSDSFTNWFSRIEILLASLVFQDEGTNFVDEADNTTQMENTLSQSVDTLSQAVSIPENVTGKIDNMGQSFLGLLDEWRIIVSCNSFPSQFVLCDVNLSSQNRDSSSDSVISSFRLETSLDSGEFRQFLDFCHAITTILFTMLFVWLSIMLLSFLLASLAKLAQFCYLVYSALFGG